MNCWKNPDNNTGGAGDGIAYTGVFDEGGATMSNDTKDNDGSPKFGRLLLVLIGAVVFCGVLTWVMGTFFPDFPR